MGFWAALLRALGTVLILLTINEAIMIASQFPVLNSWLAFSNFIRPQIERLALVALCFGGASGLLTLQRADQRLARAGASRQRVQPMVEHATGFIPPPPSRDLAPVAPNWVELPEPPPYGGGAAKRLERRYRDGAAGIAHAFDERLEYVTAQRTMSQPPVIHDDPIPSSTTPGAENQYAPSRQRGVPNPMLRNRDR